MRSLEEFIKYVKDRAYNLDVRYAGGNNTVYVSVYFIRKGEKENIIYRQSRHALSDLGHKVVFQNPDVLEVKIQVNDTEELHRYDYGMRENFAVSSGENPTMNRRANDHQVTKSDELSGLGQSTPLHIESIVNKRLEEERKNRKLDELQTKSDELTTRLKNKETEIENLKNFLEEKQIKIEGLERTIENKKSFKYYAGITGDILQSFGIRKEIIGKPLAGLLSAEGTTTPAMIEQKASDDSGIVDENNPSEPPSGPRNEMLHLLRVYLDNIDTRTLEKLFEIFSEIENDNSNADRILSYIKKQ